jgi:DNA polymerase-1
VESLLTSGKLPNLRDLITPDTAYSIIDMDLNRADVQIVAREANCKRLLELLEAERHDPTLDLHTANAGELFGADKAKQKHYRDLGKKVAHAANYLVSPPTLSQQTGIPKADCARFIDRWYSLNPEIPQWHARVETQIGKTREVRNPFGFRRFFFGRLADCLPEAVAWVPQSTVGLVINHALLNIYRNLPEVKLLLQVHDSLVMQVQTTELERLLPLIQAQSSIPVPYDPPLIIPVGFKVSDDTWGKVMDVDKYREQKRAGAQFRQLA